MPITHRRMWLLILFPLAACSSDTRAPTDWNGVVRDSSGVRIVENPARGIWAEGETWTLEEDLRIGSVEDDPTYQFGEIAGVAAGPSGDIVVLDMQADYAIRVFDENGRHLTGSGTWGSGPGEFGTSAGPVLNAGDSLLLIPDNGNRRIHLFDFGGRFLRSIPVTLTELTNRSGATSLGVPVLQVGLSMVAGMQETDDLVDVLLAIGTDGTARDTLLTFPSGRRFYFEGGVPELTFFAPEPLWNLAADDAILLGINNSYAISTYRGGVLQRIVSREHTPVALSERDREIVLDAWIRVFAERIPNADATLRQLAQFHDVFPAYQRFLVCADGSLWVQQTLVPSTLSEHEAESFDPTGGWGSRRWDVFDADGRYLGEVEFPSRFEVAALLPDLVLGVWRDELDVEHVRRLRILR